MPFVPDKPKQYTGANFYPDHGEVPKEQKLSPWQEIQRNPMLLTPSGMAARGMEEVSNAIEHGAYDAGGRVTDLTGSPVAGYATNVGIQSIPALAGAWGGSTQVAPRAVEMARRLVRSAIKPPSSMNSAKVEQAISSIIEKDIPTTNSSMEALGTKSKAIDDKVEAMIAKSEARVPRGETERHLINEIRATGEADVVDPEMAKMGTALERYRELRPENMPVQMVHAAKKANYAATGNRPYMQNPDANTAMADKIRMSLARGQREATVNAAPETAPLLKEQSDMLNVMKVAGPRLLMEGNKNPIGMGSITPSTARLLMWMIDRDAQARGAAGRLLNKAAQAKIPTAAGGISGAALADQLGLGKPEQ